jgi:Fatty acid desaturase
MILRQEELTFARAYAQNTALEALTRDQMKRVMDRGRKLFHWYRSHMAIHYAINLAVLLVLLGGDALILLELPRLVLGSAASASFGRVLLASLVCGSLHSYLLYSLSVYSMHEGAAHGIVFPGDNPVSNALNWVAANLCRVAASEPRYYSEHHMSHHAKFGTEDDGEFLNFVLPRRYWLTLLPFAALLNYTDFIAHRPAGYTRGRIASAVVALTYHGVYGWLMTNRFGGLFAILSFVLFLPHVGFFLDRLRQFSEHNLMPLENKDGSRSFGVGFWGLLIGGGPWGSPCHWEHHLVASLPWYQQINLHFFVKSLLTDAQKKQFLLEPVVGYPKLLIRLWTEPTTFVASAAARGQSARDAD